MDITEEEKKLIEKYKDAKNWVDVVTQEIWGYKSEEGEQIPNYTTVRKGEYILKNGKEEEKEEANTGNKTIHAIYQKVWNRNKPKLIYDDSTEISMEPVDGKKFIIMEEDAKIPSTSEKIENSRMIYFDEDYKQKTYDKKYQIVTHPKKGGKPEGSLELPSEYEVLIPSEEINEYETVRTKYIPLRVYDTWNFSKCDPRWGIKRIKGKDTDYPGQIPGQIICNLLHYYTEKDDLVVDFMAGGGTTQDVCEDKRFQRRCLSFDKKLEDRKPIRSFIKYHNLRQPDGSVKLPELPEKPKLIFVDPPYWSMKDEEYGEDSISALTLPEFYDFIEKFAKECYDILPKDGIFAFLIQNQTEKHMTKGNEAILHTHTCEKIFEDIGFEYRREIHCDMGTQTFTAQQVIKAKKETRMLGTVRDLIIMRK